MSHEKARVLVAMWNGRWSTSEKGKDDRNIGNRIREDEEERVRRPTDRNETLGYQVFCNALSELGEGKNTVKDRLPFEDEGLLQRAGSHKFPCRRHSSLSVVHKRRSVGGIYYTVLQL